MGLLFLVFSVLAVMFAYMVWINKIARGVCQCKTRMDSKTVIVTGANCGIGKETALDLAARGAKVILACMDLNDANQAKDDIVRATGSRNVLVRRLDLASLRTVRAFAAEILNTEKRLDVLVNNAGATNLPKDFTEDDLDTGMQVNHLGPFLLTCLLLDLLRRTPGSRIVTVSSVAHAFAWSFDPDNMNQEKGFVGKMSTYCHAKLCNVLMTQYLAKKLKGSGVTANCLHPGGAYTEITRITIKNPWIKWTADAAVGAVLKTAKDGAQTSIHLAVSAEGARVSGKYFVDLKEAKVGNWARVPDLAEKVWKKSEYYVRLTIDERPFK